MLHNFDVLSSNASDPNVQPLELFKLSEAIRDLVSKYSSILARRCVLQASSKSTCGSTFEGGRGRLDPTSSDQGRPGDQLPGGAQGNNLSSDRVTAEAPGLVTLIAGASSRENINPAFGRCFTHHVKVVAVAKDPFHPLASGPHRLSSISFAAAVCMLRKAPQSTWSR